MNQFFEKGKLTIRLEVYGWQEGNLLTNIVKKFGFYRRVTKFIDN